MDAFFHSLIAARIIFIFSITNVVLVILVFLSCRCMPGFKFGHSLLQNKSYLKFYKFHVYLWLILFISVLIHAIFAINMLGFPA